jgi:hypothetical protein
MNQNHLVVIEAFDWIGHLRNKAMTLWVRQDEQFVVRGTANSENLAAFLHHRQKPEDLPSIWLRLAFFIHWRNATVTASSQAKPRATGSSRTKMSRRANHVDGFAILPKIASRETTLDRLRV